VQITITDFSEPILADQAAYQALCARIDELHRAGEVTEAIKAERRKLYDEIDRLFAPARSSPFRTVYGGKSLRNGKPFLDQKPTTLDDLCALADTCAQPAYVVDPQGRHIHINPAAIAIAGQPDYAAEWPVISRLVSAEGKTLPREVLPCDQTVRLRRAVPSRPVICELRDGRRIEVMIIPTPIFHRGELLGVISIAAPTEGARAFPKPRLAMIAAWAAIAASGIVSSSERLLNAVNLFDVYQYGQDFFEVAFSIAPLA
jgi:PAS domain-containing protein